MSPFHHKHLLSTKDLNLKEIQEILDTAASFKEVIGRDIKKVPTLRGKTIINLFLEDSTRTRASFEIAGKRLSADVINFSKKGTSLSKGETFTDTAKTLEAMRPHILVVRVSESGFPLKLSEILQCSVINAGDGIHEHPTQALLDLFTVLEKKKTVKKLKVGILGDIAHSRVARSNIYLFKKMGAIVRLIAPYSLFPSEVEKYGVEATADLIEGISDLDVLIVLRIQKERMGVSPFPSLREYSSFYGIDKKKLKFCKEELLILHPGPVNRGVEISPDVADGKHSLILDQVSNGIAMRMAILYLVGKNG